MNKKLLISLVMIGVMAFGAGIGSYAWFTSNATSTDNVFETGYLEITGPDTMVGASWNTPSNIYPSWTSGEQTITVTNSGTLDLRYRIGLVAPTELSVDEEELLDALEVRIENAAGTNLTDVSGDGFVSLGALTPTEIGSIVATEGVDTGTFGIEFRLPSTVGNELNIVGGVDLDVDFLFEATQTHAEATY